MEKDRDEEQLSLNNFPWIQNGFGSKIHRTAMSWNSLENSLENLGTLDFDEIWPPSSWLHLITRKNQFPSKEDQKFELHSKREFGLISQ
jgi:hypothetical protein